MVTLEQIEKLLDRKLQDEREHTKDAIEAAVQGSEKRIMEAIKESQEDTIQTLSELIHTGYNHHERRIKRLEEHTHLPPLAE